MTVRAYIRAALLAAGTTAFLAAPSSAQPDSPVVPVPSAPVALAPEASAPVPSAPLVAAATDTSVTGAAALIVSSRAAYQAAWAQRQAGEPAAAVETAQNAVLEIETALMSDMDASARRELIEMRNKLTGLRDAASRSASRGTSGDRSAAGDRSAGSDRNGSNKGSDSDEV